MAQEDHQCNIEVAHLDDLPDFLLEPLRVSILGVMLVMVIEVSWDFNEISNRHTMLIQPYILSVVENDENSVISTRKGIQRFSCEVDFAELTVQLMFCNLCYTAAENILLCLADCFDLALLQSVFAPATLTEASLVISCNKSVLVVSHIDLFSELLIPLTS